MIGMPTSPHPPDYEGFGSFTDPYVRCEDKCNHDLAHGVLISDLFSSDGPYRMSTQLHIRRPAEYGDVDPTPDVTQLLASPSTSRRGQGQGEEHEGNS